MPDQEAWERLGQLLIERRVALGAPKRLPWVQNVLGLKNDRVQADIENARRTNFDQATLALIEQQYEWQPGSIRRVLAGGDPEPLKERNASILTINVMEPPEEAMAKTDVEAVSELFRQTMHFARTVAFLAPSLADMATDLSDRAIRLYAAVMGDGFSQPAVSEPSDTSVHLVAADEQEQSISGEQEESETP